MDHFNAYCEPVDTLAQNSQRTRLLSEDGDDCEDCSQTEDTRLHEGPHVRPHAHNNKEDRNQEGDNRVDEVFQAILATGLEIATVDILQDESDGECAHDRGQSDQSGKPRGDPPRRLTSISPAFDS